MYCINKADIDDIEGMREVVDKRIKWMDEQDIKQWNTIPYLDIYDKQYFVDRLDYFYVVKKDNKTVGLFCLYEKDDRWVNQTDSYYVHHLATNMDEIGLGKYLIDYIEALAKANHKHSIRLDSQLGNEKLSKYYEDLGYYPCGECVDGDYVGILREKII